MKTALVIGATGLVGSQLVALLLADDRYEHVVTFVRHTTGKEHPKLVEHIIDFSAPESWQHWVTGDVLFSALGTTLKSAGSKAAQYQVDYTYQYTFATLAALHGVPTLVLVSSAGASSHSRIFYSRMKGELENAVIALPFKYIHIIQPGLLVGKRKNSRLGEKVGEAILNVAHHIPGLKQYKPIPAHTVAQAMINASVDERKALQRYTLLEVFDLANK